MMVSLLWRLDGSFRIKECPAEGKADCVIFFQEIESNLRSMEVQFGMTYLSNCFGVNLI